MFWASSDESVAMVPSITDTYRASVTAVGGGSATVTGEVLGTSLTGMPGGQGSVQSRVSVKVELGEPTRVGMERDFFQLFALAGTIRMEAVAYDDADNLVAVGSDFAWASSAGTVATVDSTGLVTAVGNGRSTISATVSGMTAEAVVEVAQRAVEFRGIAPAEVALQALGDTTRLTAQAVDANGHTVTRVGTIEWTSADETVAAVNSTGLVTAVGTGSATISAATSSPVTGTLSAKARVTVVQDIKGVRITPAVDTLRAPGEAVRLLAEPTDANGFPVADAGVVFVWSTSNETVATVDDTGLVTAVAEGAVEITAAGSAGSDISGTIDMLVWYPSDRDILVTLYNATNGSFWHNSEGWLTDLPLDSWHGVETDGDGRVVTLALSNRLHGSIPVELAYLSELRELNLSRTELTGPIPPELGRLADLESLNLYGNNFTGGIPAQLGDLSNLEELNLSENALTGAIPSDLGKLTDLERVDLSANELVGHIPPFFAGLPELRSLRLRANRLSGTIPAELGALAKLEVLDLGQNLDLTGEIPVELGGLVSLRELDLTAYACCPQFTGPIPRELSNLSELRLLELGYNRFTGSIPPELGNLADLESLTLHYSELTGSIPPSLGELQNLRRLYLPHNDLSGSIPPWLGGLTRLSELLLQGNSLEGVVPPELGNLVDLRYLLFSDNNLTGLLPPELGNLRRLEILTVAENELAGPIPTELIDLPLTRFVWEDTGLCAPTDPKFQAWLETIRDMRGGPTCFADALAALYEAAGGPGWTNAIGWLTDQPVSEWHGVTTDEEGRVTELDLRANGLSGTVPPEIGFLADLRRLDLRDNRLAGELPGELGKLAELRELYLSANRFDGRLPAALGNLSELTTLLVAGNRFTGALPGSLAGLPNLADFQWNDSGLCAPAVEWYQAWLSRISHSNKMASASGGC